jgi:hypothetical protein
MDIDRDAILTNVWALGRTIQQKKVSHVVEADIRSFFDKVNQEWLVKFLRHRIGDERVIRLIIRMLKSGIMEDGLVTAGKPRRATSRSKAAPAERSWGKACATSATGLGKPVAH